MDVQMHVFGKDELVAKYRRIASNLPAALATTMQSQMTQLADYVRANKLSGDPLNRRSGTLSSRVVGSAGQSGNSIVGKVGVSGVPYAIIWEKTGIQAHDIFPVNAKALRFFIGGRAVFAMSAHIPTQAPRPFLKPSLEENRAKIMAALRATAVGMFSAT